MHRTTARMIPGLLSIVVLLGATLAPRAPQADRLTALETRMAAVEAAQATALSRLDQMRLDVNNALEPLRVQLADSGEDLRGIGSRLVALEEQLALLNERLLALGDSGGGGAPAPRRDAGTPMPPPQPPSGVAGPSVAGRAASTAPVEPAQSEADALYSSAYTDYLAANYTLAIDGFEQYLRLFPDQESADNAQYWVAESHYSQQQYRLARTAFLEVARRFPAAETVPDAKFKAARCLVELGDSERAVDELTRLVREHPNADTLPIACLQIERLGADQPLGCPGQLR